MSVFVRSVDEGCQRGFHIRYTTCIDLPNDILRRLSTVWENVQVSCENWGPTPVYRAIVPFRFEVRFGHRVRQVSLLQRFSATDEQRVDDRDAFEGLLRDALTRAGDDGVS